MVFSLSLKSDNLIACLQATQEDNPDRFSITTLTVSRQRGPGQGWSRGAGQLSFSRAQYSSRVLESEPLHRCGVCV